MIEDARNLWIAENVANVTVLGITAALFWVRWRRAVALVRENTGPASVRMLRRVNRGFMGVNFWVAALFAALGLYLIEVARVWEGEVPTFVIIGTGCFALVWAVFAAGAIWHYLALNRVAALADDERRRRGEGLVGVGWRDDD